MKVLLEIKDDKASFVLTLLKNFAFVKAKPITPAKAVLLEELKETVDELNGIKAGKKKVRNAQTFLEKL